MVLLNLTALLNRLPAQHEDTMSAQQIGFLAWTFLMPFLLLGVIALVNWARTGGRARLQQTARRPWAIGLALLLWLLVLFSRLVG